MKTQGKGKKFGMVLTLLLAMWFLGCSSYPPNDVAVDLARQLAEKYAYFPTTGEAVEVHNVKFTIINQYHQKFDDEDQAVIEFAVSADEARRFGPDKVIHESHTLDRFTVAYIRRGNSWYGRIINEGTRKIKAKAIEP